jgi:tripartite-type tricarboxylate transporter receptor subunit TctC
LSVASLLATGCAYAQQPYPTRPIRLLVPFPPGGQADIVARMMAQKLGETFKHSLVVDNRGGGGGVIAAETAVRAIPDGYTMILVTASYAANAALYKPNYDPLNDVTPVVFVGEGGNVAAVHPTAPVASIKEVIAYDKANPGKLNYGSSGTGSSTHLATELFNQMAGIRLTHVPYKGTPAGLNDLFGGQIQFMIGSMPAMIPHVKSNRLRGIGVTTARRSNAIPDVPAIAEIVPGYEAVNWAAVLGPHGLPGNVVALWNSEVNRILQMQDVKERMAADGMETTGGTQERLRDVLKRDIAKWQRVVNVAAIKVGN